MPRKKSMPVIPGYVGPRSTPGVRRFSPIQQDDIVCYTRDFVKRSGIPPVGLPLNGKVVRIKGDFASVHWCDREDGQIVMVHAGNLVRYDERHKELP